MALMVRPSGKGKKIAYALLGVPPAMQKKKRTKKEKQMLFEDSY